MTQVESSVGIESVPAGLKIGTETCPACGQEIPPDRLHEISGKIAAREREQTLAITTKLKEQHELEKAAASQKAKAELEAVKTEAAKEATRIRQEAKDSAEALLRDKVAASEKAAAAANAKAREAEGKLAALAQEHASKMAESLSSQREIMDKAKEDALNAEKAKAFDEAQKLSNKVNELQRALEKKTNEELGEGAEIDLLEALKKNFPDDKITRVGRGAPGADILHVVMLRGKKCGTIIYDSKNHKQFRGEHVTKLKADQLAASAEHAILSTHKFPEGTRQLHLRDGVLLANPARVVTVAALIRQHLLLIHTLRLSAVERENKTAALYEFVTSERCTLLLDRIDQRASDLLDQQAKEMKWHENNWKKQGEALRAIQKAKADLENEISGIIETSADDSRNSQES